MKVLSYNSSARGSGQYVRSVKIAKILSEHFKQANILVIAGNSYFKKDLPPRTEIIKLPEIRKNLKGEMITNLGDLKKILLIRKKIIETVIENYSPDIFLVDTRPTGLDGELLDILKKLKDNSECKLILLLRDIIDSPDIVQKSWSKNNIHNVLRDLYDKVIILGDNGIYNMIKEYKLEKLQQKIFHIGFLGYSTNFELTSSLSKKQILVTVGSGHDGEKIILTVCDMIRKYNFDSKFIIVLGVNSNLSVSWLKEKYSDQLEFINFITYLDSIYQYVEKSDIIISMCGYNTFYELIEMKKKMIIIPRVVSGKEQLLRSEIISKYYSGLWTINMNDLNVERLKRTIQLAMKAKKPFHNLKLEGKSNLISFFENELNV